MITMIKKLITVINPSYLVISHHEFCVLLSSGVGLVEKTYASEPYYDEKGAGYFAFDYSDEKPRLR
jgi:hypothetical protein